MTELWERMLPSIGILALIALWVLVMLCGASFFRRRLPDAPTLSQWNPAYVRLGLILFMAFVGVLVAERQALSASLRLWVGLVGGFFGFVVETLWRRYDRRYPPPGGPNGR